jgi:hypothetical protein
MLSGWLGSWALFALVIAPTAFQVLPSQEAAGALVAPVLGTLNRYGMAAGVVLAVLAALQGEGRLATLLPLVLAALCATSELAVTPAIEAAGRRAFGEAQEAGAAARFSHLHQLSRYIFAVVELGVLGLIVLRARPAAPPGPAGPPAP